MEDYRKRRESWQYHKELNFGRYIKFRSKFINFLIVNLFVCHLTRLSFGRIVQYRNFVKGGYPV